jgi:glutamine amidotransferase-like uncharacterized protein
MVRPLKMTKRIAIYEDYTFNNGSLFKALKGVLKAISPKFVDADSVLNGALTKHIDLFIMPGGASRYVSAKLDGAGNAAIKAYVANGGTYLGICAGAYYGCRRTEWHPAGTVPIAVDNELAFFPGIARGPLPFGPAVDDKIAAIVPLTLADGTVTKALYWDGCRFEGAEPETVLARYADGSAAVIAGTYGKGRYILSGPHPEINDAQLDLMTFDVVQNRHAEIAALKDRGATKDLFTHILARYVD